MHGVPGRASQKKLRHVPALLRKTLTYDRGKEMAEHEQLAQRLALQIFFADPYSPLATRHEREHEWPVAPVLAQGHGLVGLHAARVKRHRPSAEHAPTKCLNCATPLEVYAHLRHHSPVALGT